jgi:hypothetical protein
MKSTEQLSQALSRFQPTGSLPRSHLFHFANDTGFSAVLTQLAKVKFLKSASKKISVAILVGQSYALSIAPEVFTHFDLVIFADINFQLHKILQKQLELFLALSPEEETNKVAIRFYTQLLTQAFGISPEEIKDGRYSGKIHEWRNLNTLISSHALAGETGGALEKHYCFTSKERMQACQEAIKTAAKKLVFLHANLFDPKDIGQIAAMLNQHHAEISLFNATNLAKWAVKKSLPWSSPKCAVNSFSPK